MGYLLLAIISSVLVSVIMRLQEKHVQNKMCMFMANYVVCMFFSFMFMQNIPVSTSFATLVLGLISGILYLTSFVYLEMNMKKNGIVMASTFMKLGVVIPTLMAIFVFKEIPKWTQILGILISLMAIIMINYEKTDTQSAGKKSWLLILLLLSGFTDSMSNIFDKSGFADEKDMYLFITFFIAFFLTIFFMMQEKKKIGIKDIVCGMCIGIPNYFSSRFLLLALTSVPSMLVYPLFSIGTIVCITIAGVILFKEKLSTIKKLAVACILMAVCLLNM